MLSKTQDDLAEMSLELGQTVRIFGFLQFAEKVDSSMQKVPGFSNTEVLGLHRNTTPRSRITQLGPDLLLDLHLAG